MKLSQICSLIVFVTVLLLSRMGNAETGQFSEPSLISVAAGPFIRGSDRIERELAYTLDEKAYGHSLTRERGWYENEYERHQFTAADFFVTRMLITNRDYSYFINDTGHPAPNVTEKTWQGYGLIHPFKRTHKFNWKNNIFGEERGDHPVVLVSWNDARAYATWLSRKTGKNWKLPTEIQWEKAVRGVDGRYFPWGNNFEPTKLNSHDLGPFDTVPVGRYPGGHSPYGLMDGSGQVFEWMRNKQKDGRIIVKGGSWDDRGCGVCRPAARHSRPDHLKHILIGFRLVLED